MYFAGFIFYSLFSALRKPAYGKLGFWALAIGLIPHTIGFFVRWKLSAHVPLSNMYEYLFVMGWMAVIMQLVFHRVYRKPLIGALISPVVFMLMVAAALLPKDINQSLMPALQSIWLHIHVSLAALGSGCFLISYAVSSIYMIRQFNPNSLRPVNVKRATTLVVSLMVGLPIVLTIAGVAIGFLPPTPQSFIGAASQNSSSGGVFVLLGLGFVVGSILASVLWSRSKSRDDSGLGSLLFALISFVTIFSGLIVGALISNNFIGITHNLHSHTTGVSKSAWLIFEYIGWTYAIGLIIAAVFFPLLKKFILSLPPVQDNILHQLDELSYKAVSLAYPLYTIGALFAGAIWAEQAWGSFWSWDPKEVGALIIWLFYSGYLHARYQRGWKGRRAAILAIAGFLMVVISFFGNYFFGGLHAYA